MKQGGEVMRRKIPIPYNFIRTMYLSQKSEFVSHLILEHQIGFTNLCITVQYAYRDCLARAIQVQLSRNEGVLYIGINKILFIPRRTEIGKFSNKRN